MPPTSSETDVQSPCHLFHLAFSVAPSRRRLIALRLNEANCVEREPIVYSGSYLEYVQTLGHEAPEIYS